LGWCTVVAHRGFDEGGYVIDEDGAHMSKKKLIHADFFNGARARTREIRRVGGAGNNRALGGAKGKLVGSCGITLE